MFCDKNGKHERVVKLKISQEEDRGGFSVTDGFGIISQADNLSALIKNIQEVVKAYHFDTPEAMKPTSLILNFQKNIRLKVK